MMLGDQFGRLRPLRRRLASALVAQDRLLWAVRVRWLTIAGFLTLALIAWAAGVFETFAPTAVVAAVAIVLNGANHWCVRRLRFVLAVSAVAIPMDYVLITCLVVRTGGMQSPFVVQYVVAVLATAMLVDTFVAALSALWAVLLWSGAVVLDRYGVLPFGGIDARVDPALLSATWGAFLCYCLALLVYLGGYISDRLRSSELDLAERNQRLEESVATLRLAHTEVRTAYDRLRQAEAQLIQSEKLRGLGQLVAGVAHELNNPISFVAGNVDHLREYGRRLTSMLAVYDGLEWPAARRGLILEQRRALRVEEAIEDLPGLITDCEEGARRAREIVSELRNFARSEERDAWRSASLRQGIENTLALLGHRLKGRVRVNRDLQDVPDVECLPGQLNQVFMNLLANALDSLPAASGNLWISLRESFDAGAPCVCVEVRDDGCGIPSEVQSRIFEPFFTTKPIGQGMGLGLSVSYGIVERHHGRLEVESAVGQGTRFRLILPVLQSQPLVSAASSIAPLAQSLAG